jgi:biopolymer transport protein ExbB
MLNDVLQDLAFYINAGGYVMPPLVLATFVLWFALGYRLAVLRRGTRRGARVVLERMARGIQPKNQGVIVRAARKGLALQAQGLPYLRRFLDDAFADEERDLKRFNILITTIVMVSPLLGLLGTVVGMIETFDSLGDLSLFSQSGGIAGGISQALFTTQMGLAVSIPGLIVNGMLSRRAKEMELELAQMKDILCSA